MIYPLTSIAKEPYSSVIFQGGGSGPPVPYLDPRMGDKYQNPMRWLIYFNVLSVIVYETRYICSALASLYWFIPTLLQ